jgi:GAF domain-containing protein
VKALFPDNEKARLATLSLYDILDTGEEQSCNDFTKIAAYIAQTPIALISIVDKERQWFKAKVGVSAPETSRDVAFCAHAILNPSKSLLVNDATKDPRFSDNPLVTGDPGIRFYFGTPLVTKDNYALGTVCVIDNKPRELNMEQTSALRLLARQVMNLLEIRRYVIALKRALDLQQKQGHLREVPAAGEKPGEVDQYMSQLQDLLLRKQIEK